ncbi:class I SAM-dependent methyltransferase [Spirosoma fluviale]|uniref:2-polyprenyl-3-methyl-5-hydroxy-6-metoxy-1,4-benzoquinol methylase n=1 Tax=Spirosoma fluviale TaxID=1597977 RepID=A0A286GLY7_9BACT|nr:class I SAM-dependent methyltransferase [Spirosoma fluviale]SOD96553.1 2-polyprenyl-3-methyl-5-hydroxy-6-metoxy-1,4-benzoquinol methylase [Spirosoma fluviale]
METVTHCPVCDNSTFSPYLVCEDYLVSNQKFEIQQCQQCGFRLTNPRPDGNSIGAYYKSDQYVSHNDKGGGLINTAYRTVRNYTLQSKLNLINELTGKPGRIVDVGCGTGAFLESCQKGGWAITGMEPDPDARAMAKEKLQAEVKPDLEALAGAEPFDIVSLWHVLEHIPNLSESIQQLRNLLTEQGTLLIAVPNSDSYDAQLFKEYWAAYDVPRHLHHFTPLTIEPLFNKHGFKLVKQLPMVFDAFYIAMLSTRYQNGKTDYLKSVQVGLSSNVKARSTGNSSSLIYLFKQA